MSAETRFWEKLTKTDSCWFWSASRSAKGYGWFWDGTRMAAAHRFSYELHKGPIPKGWMVRHTCDQESCVNPSHLILGRALENNRDKVVRGRATATWGYN